MNEKSSRFVQAADGWYPRAAHIRGFSNFLLPKKRHNLLPYKSPLNHTSYLYYSAALPSFKKRGHATFG